MLSVSRVDFSWTTDKLGSNLDALDTDIVGFEYRREAFDACEDVLIIA